MMQKQCDNCKGSVKTVGKLFKVKFMMLCKSCRRKGRVLKLSK